MDYKNGLGIENEVCYNFCNGASVPDNKNVIERVVFQMDKVEELLAKVKLNELVGKKQEEEKKKPSKAVIIFAIIGVIVAIAAAAYGIYRFFTPDYLDDFEDDFDDDFDEDFFEDDDLDPKQETTKAAEEK